MPSALNSTIAALTWCLAWGNNLESAQSPRTLRALRKAFQGRGPIPPELQPIVTTVQNLFNSPDYPQTQQDFPSLYPETPIGLIFGGATKIKQYVFETSNLQDLRGASALLDRINLIDLPSFFSNLPKDPAQNQTKPKKLTSALTTWFTTTYPELSQALIPELIIYSTGGNILAFCPAAYTTQLANAIEQCYTRETLIANSCAVGDRFHLAEFRFGRNCPPYLNDYLNNPNQELLNAYFGPPNPETPAQPFHDRKAFNELVAHLASQFNRRRSGNLTPDRHTRAHPPLYETHPYIQRDDSNWRSTHSRITALPSQPKFSEASARKYIMGQIAKQDTKQDWWPQILNGWEPGKVESWVTKFITFINKPENTKPNTQTYTTDLKIKLTEVDESRSLREIGSVSTPPGFVAYIYADGNNMGSYIQKSIKTPQAYQQFSQDISEATEQAVYHAIAQHLQPAQHKPDPDSNRKSKNPVWIHPFEILTIGGDDVFLVVPADRALAIAKTISEEFERLLLAKNPNHYGVRESNCGTVHRYQSMIDPNPDEQCKLSMSVGVLLTAEDTPIYYAADLVGQLLKSAKQKAKSLKKQNNYYGGTIDFLVMKSVTMISSNIAEFRTQGLTQQKQGKPILKFYGAPYTLYEIGGLLTTLDALKKSDYPRSQLYQVRSLLEQGKQTAMLNYRYFRVRLADKGEILINAFEKAWCQCKENEGNLAPWMTLLGENTTIYETIWRELVDLYAFTAELEQTESKIPPSKTISSKPTTYRRNPISPVRKP